MPAFRTVGGHRRILRSDLEAFCRRTGIPFSDGDGGAGRRILIVDEDAQVRERVEKAARTFGGDLTVQSAANAFDAGRAIETFRPQVAFIDIGMARGAGQCVLESIKSCELGNEIAVVVLDGRYTKGSPRRYTARGASECLKRPPEEDEVREALRRILA